MHVHVWDVVQECCRLSQLIKICPNYLSVQEFLQDMWTDYDEIMIMMCQAVAM